MEPKLVGISRKVWNIMRVAIFMIKKGICKRKLVMDLNVMMKRGKIARKTLGNLMFHPNNHHVFTSQGGVGESSNLPNKAREYEFSCRATPVYRHYFTNKLRKNHHTQNNNDNYYMPYTFPLEHGENVCLEDHVSNMLDMMISNEEGAGGGGGGGVVVSAASLALRGLGFGRSPSARQLRVTDSPFPVRDTDHVNDKHVDQDAEDFIKSFYSQLKQQN